MVMQIPAPDPEEAKTNPSFYEEAFVKETILKGIEAMEDFYLFIHMPTNLRELGVEPTEEQLRTMAHMCSLAAGGCKGSAKKLYEEDMLAIYRMAL